MTQSPKKVSILRLAALVSLCLVPAIPIAAQSLFDVVARVNDSAVTRFEVLQRTRLQAVIRTPGASEDLALENLIDDRLKLDAAKAAGITPTSEEIQLGLEDFASRANLTADEFVEAIAPAGVEPETLRDYIQVNLAWGDLVRTRFSSRAQISEQEVDRALALGTGGGSARVLLSEIILPVTPELAAVSQERAQAISQITTLSAFENAARQFSIAPTRTNGGRLDWLPLSQLPPQIAPLFLTMSSGEVTEPVPLDDSIALFQFRGLQDVAPPLSQDSVIDYARLRFPAGTNLTQERSRISALIDQCDDLYGLYKGAGEDVLIRDSQSRNALPAVLRNVIDPLDQNEIAILGPQSSGDGGSLVMLCSRVSPTNEDLSREDVTRQLFARRLSNFANGYLAELRADAFIEIVK